MKYQNDIFVLNAPLFTTVFNLVLAHSICYCIWHL